MGKKDDREVATIEELIQDATEADIEAVTLKSGKIVWIKPLSRKQALRFRNAKMARDVFEQKLVSMAMVEPAMTATQVSAWQDKDKANGDLNTITNKICEISGMAEKVEGMRNDTKSNN